VREIAQGRPGQAFNKGLTVVALPELWSNEQMAGRPETIFEWRVPHDLESFPTCRPDQAAEWRLTISDGEMSTSEPDSRSGCSHAGGSYSPIGRAGWGARAAD